MIGESEGPRIVSSQIHYRVFLFDSKPWDFLGACIKDLFCEVAEIGSIRLSQCEVTVCFTEHKDVRCAPEGVFEQADRLEEDFRVVASGLLGGRAVLVPSFELIDVFYSCAVSEHPCLSSQFLLSSYPDLLCKNRPLYFVF